MGLFNFFKPKNKNINNNRSEKSPIEADLQGKFNLHLSDFSTKRHSAEVISVKLSPDFYELFPEANKSVETGKRQISTSVVKLIFWGQHVEVSFDPNVTSSGSEEFIIKINNQLNWLIKHKHLVDEVIIRDLLPLKNDSWLDENETVLSEERFLEAISLTSIDFDQNAGATLYYDDGNTFFGHTIVVEISSKQKVKQASIAG